MKSLVLFLVTFFVLFINITAQEPTPEWIIEKRKGITVQSLDFVGFNFNTKSERINFNIQCEKTCDIVLVTTENLAKLRKGENFEYHYYLDNTLEASWTFYDIRFIKQTMWICVRNLQPSGSFRANFEIGNFMVPIPDDSWKLLTGILVPSTFFIVIGLLCSVCGVSLLLWLVIRRFQRKSQASILISQEDEDYDNVIDQE